MSSWQGCYLGCFILQESGSFRRSGSRLRSRLETCGLPPAVMMVPLRILLSLSGPLLLQAFEFPEPLQPPLIRSSKDHSCEKKRCRDASLGKPAPERMVVHAQKRVKEPDRCPEEPYPVEKSSRVAHFNGMQLPPAPMLPARRSNLKFTSRTEILGYHVAFGNLPRRGIFRISPCYLARRPIRQCWPVPPLTMPPPMC